MRFGILLLLLSGLVSCKKNESDESLSPYYGHILRGPYLQKATDKSISLIFYTATAEPSSIIISNGGQDRQFILQKATVQHIYNINGLVPGETYTYRIKTGNETWLSEESWYFTIPNYQKPFRFWVTGDFGAGNEDQIKVKRAFEHYLKDHPVNFWLWLGDNAYADGSLNKYFTQVFDNYYGYDSLMKFLPFYPTPGNHDYESVKRHGGNFHKHSGPYYEVVDVFQKGENGGVPSGTELYYSFNYGNTHFVSLNSEVWRFSVGGNLQMKKWLEKDLAANKQKWTIVFFHQPPYTFGSHHSETWWEVVMRGMRKKYVPVLEKYNVDLVLSGHSHVYERSWLVSGQERKVEKNYEKEIISKGVMMDGINYINKKDRGTMYVVSGNGGKDHVHAPEPNPMMVFGYGGEHKCGSLIFSMSRDTLLGEYLSSEGNIIDRFALVK